MISFLGLWFIWILLLKYCSILYRYNLKDSDHTYFNFDQWTPSKNTTTPTNTPPKKAAKRTIKPNSGEPQQTNIINQDHSKNSYPFIRTKSDTQAGNRKTNQFQVSTDTGMILNWLSIFCYFFIFLLWALVPYHM